MNDQVKPGFWAVLPAAVRYDEVIPPNAKLLYAEISSLTDTAGYCWAEDEYFAGVFGFSERSVKRLLETLEAAGYIQITKEKGAKNAILSRRIYAGLNPLLAENSVLPKLAKQSENGDPVLPKLSGRFAKIVKTHNIKEQEILTDTPTSPQGGARANASVKAAPSWKPERFQALRAYYPKGYAKNLQREIKAWDKLRLSDTEIDAMARGLQRMKRDPEWVRGIGIPHLSTFLNGRRWEDADDFDVDPQEPQDVSRMDTREEALPRW